MAAPSFAVHMRSGIGRVIAADACGNPFLALRHLCRFAPRAAPA